MDGDEKTMADMPYNHAYLCTGYLILDHRTVHLELFYEWSMGQVTEDIGCS